MCKRSSVDERLLSGDGTVIDIGLFFNQKAVQVAADPEVASTFASDQFILASFIHLREFLEQHHAEDMAIETHEDDEFSFLDEADEP